MGFRTSISYILTLISALLLAISSTYPVSKITGVFLPSLLGISVCQQSPGCHSRPVLECLFQSEWPPLSQVHISESQDICFAHAVIASLVTQLVKNLPAMRETWVRSLGWEDPLEKGKVTHSSMLAWRIPWTLWSLGLQGVRQLTLTRA